MYPYKYVVSLRLNHPDIDPKDITGSIGIQPWHSWRAGEPRLTPKGEKLKGVNAETYWTARLHKEKSLRSGKTSIEDFLAQQVQLLKKSKTFLNGICRTGGRAEFFIGLFSEKNAGLELPARVLGGMAELGIGLSLDIYPKDETHNKRVQPIALKAGSG